MRSFPSLAGFALLLLVAGSVAAEVPAPRRLAFAPHWLAQAQFAGYYVALDRGFYRERGLDVAILPGGPGRSASRLLEDGSADVASLWLATALQMRSRGVPLVNVAQLFGRSSLMLVAKKSSGIRRPEDLRGRKIGVWGGDFRLQPELFLQRYGVEAELVPLGPTANLFLRDGVDATVATWFNEFHTILNAGIEPSELTTLFFREHGLDLPEDGLYCRAETLALDPTLCGDFVAASLAGWQYAFAHPDEAVALTMRHMLEAHIGTNAAHQRWMLARVEDLMTASLPGDRVGVLRREDYERTALVLREAGLIAETPAFADFVAPPVASR